MSVVRIHSSMSVEGRIEAFPPEVVKVEPMFFSCDSEFACNHGGPITKAFFDALPQDWKDSDVVFDSRVHMLMRGWYPCIPGWHLDDVPRTRPDGQPDHENPEYESEHILCLVGDCSKTMFALGECELTQEDGQVVYGEWHPQIEGLLGREQLVPYVVSPLDLVRFNWQTFHKGTPATKDGWRWFGRITRNTKRKVFNEIRRQTQVYLEAPNAGW